jgi:hypothetical protein
MTPSNTAKLSLSASDTGFYTEKFGFARSGANFILEAFPFLVEKTQKELHSKLPVSKIKRMLIDYRGEILPIRFDGSALSLLFADEKNNFFRNMTAFEKLTAEFCILACTEGNSDGTCCIHTKVQVEPRRISEVGTRVNIFISNNAADFVRKFSPGGDSIGIGASFLSSQFPKMFSEELKKTSSRILDYVEKRLDYHAINMEVPQMLGWTFQQVSQEQFIDLPAFSGACLEVHCMSAEKRRKTESARPRVSKNVGDFYRSKFTNLNAGIDFAISMMPVLLDCVIQKNVVPNFSDAELDKIENFAKKLNVPLSENGHAGKTISWLAEQIGDEKLEIKIKTMSPCERMGLELYVKTRKDKEVAP